MLLSSCAKYTAHTQLIEPPSALLLMPELSQINKELKNRMFEIRNIYFDQNDSLELVPTIPKEMYPKLLEQQVRKGFLAANVNKGTLTPPYHVDIAIRQLQLKKSGFILPNQSTLRVRLELLRPNGTKMMSGEYKMLSVSQMIPLPIPGAGFLPISFSMSGDKAKLMAMSELFPAAAAVVTKVVLGLQLGKDFTQIKFFEVPMGNPTKWTLSREVLSDKPFGLTRLTNKDFEEASKLP